MNEIPMNEMILDEIYSPYWYDEDNRPMMEEDGNWQYKEINKRAKAFEDWQQLMNNKRKLKNIEKKSCSR